MRALHALARSAQTSQDGHPRYSSVAADLGATLTREHNREVVLPRATLRSWYRRAKKAGTLEDPPEPAEPTIEDLIDAPQIGGLDETGALRWASDHLGREDTTDLRVKSLAFLYQQLCRTESDPARASLAKQIASNIDRDRNEAAEVGEPTPREWVERMCTMPERMVEALALMPWLWHDSRVVELVEGRDAVPEAVANGVLFRGEEAAPADWPYHIPATEGGS